MKATCVRLHRKAFCIRTMRPRKRYYYIPTRTAMVGGENWKIEKFRSKTGLSSAGVLYTICNSCRKNIVTRNARCDKGVNETSRGRALCVKTELRNYLVRRVIKIILNNTRRYVMANRIVHPNIKLYITLRFTVWPLHTVLLVQ